MNKFWNALAGWSFFVMFFVNMRGVIQSPEAHLWLISVSCGTIIFVRILYALNEREKEDKRRKETLKDYFTEISKDSVISDEALNQMKTVADNIFHPRI